MDIDTAFKNADFNQQTIIKMIKEIISIDLDDNVKLSYSNISTIRDEDEYGGFRVDIIVKLENIKEKFHIDIATENPITPEEIVYKYKPILGKEYINLWTYNLETVLAEKIETILSRGEVNGRMRDFYGVYLIYKTNWKNINIDHFRQAIEKTFIKRQYVGESLLILKSITKSSLLRIGWKNYQIKYEYANGIDFDEVINCIEEIIKLIIPVVS